MYRVERFRVGVCHGILERLAYIPVHRLNERAIPEAIRSVEMFEERCVVIDVDIWSGITPTQRANAKQVEIR